LDNLSPAKEEIVVFPNPTKGDIFLKIPDGKLPDTVQLILLDGKSVDVFLKVDKDLGVYILDGGSALSSGVYILQLYYNDELHSIPVVVTH
jgi:hypothetical protein